MFDFFFINFDHYYLNYEKVRYNLVYYIMHF
jgi:hypothetical protein